MELSELSEEKKIELFKMVREKYAWCKRPASVRAMAKNLIVTGKFKT